MNAIEHGNRNDPSLKLRIAVAASDVQLTVRITDHGGDRTIPAAETPNVAAKLEGRESPRGWGLFLIEQMVDGIRHERDSARHTLELQLRLEEDDRDRL